jgi:hypothetical protein
MAACLTYLRQWWRRLFLPPKCQRTSTWHNPEDNALHSHRSQSLRSNTVINYFRNLFCQVIYGTRTARLLADIFHVNAIIRSFIPRRCETPLFGLHNGSASHLQHCLLLSRSLYKYSDPPRRIISAPVTQPVQLKTVSKSFMCPLTGNTCCKHLPVEFVKIHHN